MSISKISSIIILAFITVISLSVNANATEPELSYDDITEVETEEYQAARWTQSTLTISNNKGTCYSFCQGKSWVTELSLLQVLEKKNANGTFSEVSGASWSCYESSNTIWASNDKYGLSSGTYRLKSVFSTTSGGVVYEDTVYSNEVTI